MSFEYRVKRQRRKTIALHVLADASVELRAPNWVAQRELQQFVDERTSWVLKRRATVLARLDGQPKFVDGDRHLFLGQRYPLDIHQRGRASTVFDGQYLSMALRDPEDGAQAERALDSFYRREAKKLFAQRLQVCLQHCLQRFQPARSVSELKLRRMRSRWGSCSSRGVITLNLELIKMPQALIDYVIYHELVHLWVFDHSPEFHRKMSQLQPDWKLLKKQLESHPLI